MLRACLLGLYPLMLWTGLFFWVFTWFCFLACLAPRSTHARDLESWSLGPFLLFCFTCLLRFFESGLHSGSLALFSISPMRIVRLGHDMLRDERSEVLIKLRYPFLQEIRRWWRAEDCHVIDVMNGYTLCADLFGPSREYKTQIQAALKGGNGYMGCAVSRGGLRDRDPRLRT